MERLFLGIGGRVACVSKEDGKTLWTTKLKSTSGVTTVHHEEGSVFACAGGHLFCLDPQSGSIRWKNALKGLGYGACIIASENQPGTVAATHTAQAESAAVTAAVTAAAAASSASQNGSGT